MIRIRDWDGKGPVHQAEVARITGLYILRCDGRAVSTSKYGTSAAPISCERCVKANKPEPGKEYALTGKRGETCISNGNTWAESEVTK